MPMLFYGRLVHDKRRELYSKDLRPIESTVFDNYRVRMLAPYYPLPDLANLWWFVDRSHTAVSWNECRLSVFLHRGLLDNETRKMREQTIFIPRLVSHIEALEIIRSEFPDYLIPSPTCFRFNNQDKAYIYND